MRFARRVLHLFWEKVSVAVGGSLLWWIGEHLVDKGVDQAIKILGHLRV
jgi:hypothetical protein